MNINGYTPWLHCTRNTMSTPKNDNGLVTPVKGSRKVPFYDLTGETAIRTALKKLYDSYHDLHQAGQFDAAQPIFDAMMELQQHLGRFQS